jgi:hypothetical protein
MTTMHRTLSLAHEIMLHRRARACVLAVALVLSGVAACGDGDDDGPHPNCGGTDNYHCSCNVDDGPQRDTECSPKSQALPGAEVVCCAESGYPTTRDSGCTCAPVMCLELSNSCACAAWTALNGGELVVPECTASGGRHCCQYDGGMCACDTTCTSGTPVDTCTATTALAYAKARCDFGTSDLKNAHVISQCNPPGSSSSGSGGSGGSGGGSSGDPGDGLQSCSSDADCGGKPCASHGLAAAAPRYCSETCVTDADCSLMLDKVPQITVPAEGYPQFGTPVPNDWGATTLSRGIACNVNGVCEIACPEGAALVTSGSTQACECLPNYRRTANDGCEWNPDIECSIFSYFPASALTSLGIAGTPTRCEACNSNSDDATTLDCHSGVYGCDFTTPGRFEGECAEIITSAQSDACLAQATNFTCDCDTSCIEDCMSQGCEDVCCDCTASADPWTPPSCP